MEWKFKPFEYPSTWKDEFAIYGLYQPFKRSREADPTSYNSKLNFWTILIQDYCTHNHVVVFSEVSLKKCFSRFLNRTNQSHEPACLGTVLWEMWNTPSTLRPLTEYSTMGLVSKVASVGFDWLVKKPISWSWSMVTGSRQRERIIKSVGPEMEFVLQPAVEKLSNEFLKWLSCNEFSHLRPSQDLNILLKSDYETALMSFFPDEQSRIFVHSWLLQNRFIAEKQEEINSQTFEVVKFASGGRSNDIPVQFTDDDRSLLVVLQLRNVVNKLEREAGHLQTNLDERKAAVRALVREKKKSDALRLLRRGKVLEKALEQKHCQIEKVESLLLQIESSKGNRHLIGALSMANSAMKDALGDTSRDSLEDTMAELQDTYDQHQEVNEALAELGPGAASDEELEAELQQLLSGQGGEQSKRREMPRKFPVDEMEDLDSQLAELDLSLELPDVSNLPPPSLNEVGDSLSSNRKRMENIPLS